MGLREAKKRKTQKSISDIATRLFLEKGFHAVTVEEIAAEAEVSVPTLFKYFPSKVAMVFDEDEQREEAVLSALSQRPTGTSILDALQAHFEASPMIEHIARGEAKAFLNLVNGTPELESYARQRWVKSEKVLATALRNEGKNVLTNYQAQAMASFVVNILHQAMGADHPKVLIREAFELLRNGFKN